MRPRFALTWLAAVAIALMLSRPGSAQMQGAKGSDRDAPGIALDLDALPIAEAGPANRRLEASIREELQSLAQESDGPELLPRRRLRELAAALLASPNPEARLAGWRLARIRLAVDRFIEQVHRPEIPAAERRQVEWQRVLLRRFAEPTAERVYELAASEDRHDHERLDEELAWRIAPLLEALAGEPDRMPPSHWPSKRRPSATSPRRVLDADAEAADQEIDALAAWNAEAERLAGLPLRRELLAVRATLRKQQKLAEARRRAANRDEGDGGDEVPVDRAAALAAAAAHAADLERLVELSTLVDRVAAIDRRAAPVAATKVRGLAAPLAEPLQRPQAVRQIDRLLATEPLRLLPGEPALRDPEAALPDPIAGRRDEIVPSIDLARREWVDAWIRGDDGTADAVASSIRTLRRLLALAAAAPSTAVEGSPGRRLERWAAWIVPAEAIDGTITTLPPRLALALEAWQRRDLATANQRMQEWERQAPLTATALSLDQALGPALTPLAGGAVGDLECLVTVPGGSALLPGGRRVLAELGLLRHELDLAEREGRREDAERFRAQLSARVAVVAESLGSTP